MIGNDYDVPVMYQDLGAYSMNPYGAMMPGMYGVPFGATNYLGGVTMQPILCEDKVELINKKNADGNKTAKKAGLILGGLLLLGFVPVIGKFIKNGGIKNALKKGWDSIKNLFSSSAQAPAPAPKPSLLQRFKNLFKKTP